MCVIPHSRNNKSRIAVREGDFCRCLWGFRCSFLPHTSTQTVSNYWEKEDLNCLRWITFNISSVSKYPLRTQLIFTLHTESIRRSGVEDPLESVQREWSKGFSVTWYVGSRNRAFLWWLRSIWSGKSFWGLNCNWEATKNSSDQLLWPLVIGEGLTWPPWPVTPSNLGKPL